MSLIQTSQRCFADQNTGPVSASHADVVLVKVAPETITQGNWYHIPLLGLGYLASYLRARGISVAIVDAMFKRLSRQEITQQIVSKGPRMVCFTAMTHEIRLAAETAESVRKELPDVCTVVGGCHCTALPKRTLEEFPVFDFGVFGEGEQVLLELYETLYKKVESTHCERYSVLPNTKAYNSFEKDVREVPDSAIYPSEDGAVVLAEDPLTQLGLIDGLVWRREGVVVQNAPRVWIDDLDSLPFPAWDLYEPSSVYRVYGSRGCPFRCIFCMRVLGDKVRYRSVKNVVDEFEWVVQQYHPKEIDFSDETFTLRRRWVLEICDELILRGLHRKTTWSANGRVNTVDESLLRRMREAGCVRVGFGIESGNEEILKVAQKGTSLQQVEKAVSACKRVGLDVAAFYILGFPGETRQQMLDTIRLAAQLNTTSAAFGVMVPYPGTKVAEMAKRREGRYRLLSENWSDFDKHLGNALELETVSRRELERLQARAYLWFYLRNLRIWDLAGFLWGKRKAVWKNFRKMVSSPKGRFS